MSQLSLIKQPAETQHHNKRSRDFTNILAAQKETVFSFFFFKLIKHFLFSAFQKGPQKPPPAAFVLAASFFKTLSWSRCDTETGGFVWTWCLGKKCLCCGCSSIRFDAIPASMGWHDADGSPKHRVVSQDPRDEPYDLLHPICRQGVEEVVYSWEINLGAPVISAFAADSGKVTLRLDHQRWSTTHTGTSPWSRTWQSSWAGFHPVKLRSALRVCPSQWSKIGTFGND